MYISLFIASIHRGISDYCIMNYTTIRHKNSPVDCFKSTVLPKHLPRKARAKCARGQIHKPQSWQMKAILMLNVSLG